MALLNEVLHRIRVKLYPNHLPGKKGTYIARPETESMLSIEDICASMKTRGGYTGSYSDSVVHVRLFLDELAYKLCNGFSANLEYFSLHSNIIGIYNENSAGVYSGEGLLSFLVRIRKKLRDLAKYTEVLVEGIARTGGYIYEFSDIATGAVNETITPGGQFILTGHGIKAAGADGEEGVFFSAPGDSENDPAIVIKAGNFAENTSSRIIGMVPLLPAGKEWTVEVHTKISGRGQTSLKEMRIIKSPFTLAP
jgi:hypothetical protein